MAPKDCTEGREREREREREVTILMALMRGEALLAITVICLNAVLGIDAQLRLGFYSFSCPRAEFIVREEVAKAVSADRNAAAALLRLHFHDCFVGDQGQTGCEGSILIDSTRDNEAEKDAVPNQTLSGFEIIDNIKRRLEAVCLGIVSCADVLAFAARDSVALSGGLLYRVPGGRRDGRVSRKSDAVDIPPPTTNLPQLLPFFTKKGLDQDDLVVLSGAHTIGRSHCNAFSNRLNSSSIGGSDPSLNPGYADQLEQQCPPTGSDDVEVPMDPPSPALFDTSYYRNLLVSRGLFTSDQTLMSTAATAAAVRQLAGNPWLFQGKFAAAVTKMGQIGVLTGNQGEIRADCRVINP